MTSPLKILVVEDDLQLLEYLCALLTDWGYDCAKASSAKDALASFERACPHVILSDLVMPRMGGVELLKALKQRIGEKQRDGCGECGGPIFFILVTGKGTGSTAVRAIMEGADEVLLKPIDEAVLHDLLQSVDAKRLTT